MKGKNRPNFRKYTAIIPSKRQDNEGGTIHNRLEAWLTFLCRDEPELIMKLLKAYPEFIPLYKDIYELCLNMEKVIGMFSKELLEMDRNTVDLMIDEMQAEIDRQADKINHQAEEINMQVRAITELKQRLAQR